MLKSNVEFSELDQLTLKCDDIAIAQYLLIGLSFVFSMMLVRKFRLEKIVKNIFPPFILFLLAVTLPLAVLGEEFVPDKFYGMQLAFTRLPTISPGEESKNLAKPKPNATPAIRPTPSPVTKPSAPPKVTPGQSAPVKPVSKPVQHSPTPVLPTPPTTEPQLSVTKGVQKLEWIIGLGFDSGGAELGLLFYSNGTTRSIKANKGVFVNAGVIFPNDQEGAFSTQLTVGYKLGGAKGDNASVIWSAIPLEVVQYYRAQSVRMGLGLSYQINPKLDIKLPVASSVDQYGNAVGFIAQIGWAPVAGSYSIDLRYTSIKFKLSSPQDVPGVDGSVVGLYTSYRF